MPLWKHVGIRLIEADYVYSHQNFFPNGTVNPSGAEISGGLMWYFGGAPPLPPMAASCSVQPTAVLAGEPVTANANVTNIPPKHSVTYDWKTTGGKLAPKDAAATIDTTGLAPGQYTVTATATDTKPKKNSVPATCNAQFTINEPPKHPPTLSCSANPATVKSGEPATITSTGENPDNRPLTYSYTATAGRVSGTGTTATLDTAGAPAGPITVTLHSNGRSWLVRELLHVGERGSSATTTAGQQDRRMRLPEHQEAVARRQHLQGSSG